VLIADIQPGPEVARIILAGELDLATERDVRQAISQVTAAPRVEVDLGKLEYCDSTGVNLFVRAYLEAQATGRSFHLVNAHGLVAKVLDVCGVLTALDGSAESPATAGP